MSDVNMMFDLRVVQNADGNWSLSLMFPDDGDGYGWRMFPSQLEGGVFDVDSWEGETLIDVMAEATASLDAALNPPEVKGDDAA